MQIVSLNPPNKSKIEHITVSHQKNSPTVTTINLLYIVASKSVLSCLGHSALFVTAECCALCILTIKQSL